MKIIDVGCQAIDAGDLTVRVLSKLVPSALGHVLRCGLTIPEPDVFQMEWNQSMS